MRGERESCHDDDVISSFEKKHSENTLNTNILLLENKCTQKTQKAEKRGN